MPEFEHPADKFNIAPQTTAKDPLQEAMTEAVEAAKVVKKVRLTYKDLRANTVLVKKKVLLGSGLIQGLDGSNLSLAEETVFDVVMVGKHTDSYQVCPKVGDSIIITQYAAVAHRRTTDARTKDGVDLSYYLVVPLPEVAAIVEYEKI